MRYFVDNANAEWRQSRGSSEKLHGAVVDLQACREIAYDHREPTPTLEDAVCGMAGTVAAICALCEDENSEVSTLPVSCITAASCCRKWWSGISLAVRNRKITRKNMSSITVSI